MEHTAFSYFATMMAGIAVGLLIGLPILTRYLKGAMAKQFDLQCNQAQTTLEPISSELAKSIKKYLALKETEKQRGEAQKLAREKAQNEAERQANLPTEIERAKQITNQIATLVTSNSDGLWHVVMELTDKEVISPEIFDTNYKLAPTADAANYVVKFLNEANLKYLVHRVDSKKSNSDPTVFEMKILA